VPGAAVRKAYFLVMGVEMDRALDFYAEAFAASVTMHTP
jgi:hypothetical protein